MEWPERNVELTDESYDSFIAGYPMVIVDFWGPSCAPCKMIAPVLEQISKEMKGKVAIGKLDVTKNLKTPARLSIRSIPTLAFYKDGRLARTKVGFVPRSGILTEIMELSR